VVTPLARFHEHELAIGFQDRERKARKPGSRAQVGQSLEWRQEVEESRGVEDEPFCDFDRIPVTGEIHPARPVREQPGQLCELVELLWGAGPRERQETLRESPLGLD
jgi:hypothetical protein